MTRTLKSLEVGDLVTELCDMKPFRIIRILRITKTQIITKGYESTIYGSVKRGETRWRKSDGKPPGNNSSSRQITPATLEHRTYIRTKNLSYEVKNLVYEKLNDLNLMQLEAIKQIFEN